MLLCSYFNFIPNVYLIKWIINSITTSPTPNTDSKWIIKRFVRVYTTLNTDSKRIIKRFIRVYIGKYWSTLIWGIG